MSCIQVTSVVPGEMGPDQNSTEEVLCPGQGRLLSDQMSRLCFPFGIRIIEGSDQFLFAYFQGGS
jgi:hypothetical protein